MPNLDHQGAETSLCGCFKCLLLFAVNWGHFGLCIIGNILQKDPNPQNNLILQLAHCFNLTSWGFHGEVTKLWTLVNDQTWQWQKQQQLCRQTSSQGLSSTTWLYYLNLWLELNSRFVFWLRKAFDLCLPCIIHCWSSPEDESLLVRDCFKAKSRKTMKSTQCVFSHKAAGTLFSAQKSLQAATGGLRHLVRQQTTPPTPTPQTDWTQVYYLKKERERESERGRVLLKSALTVVWGPKCFHLSAAKLDMRHWPNWLWETHCK